MIDVEASPDVGQLVEVRGRPWIVADSVPSALPPDVLGGETARQTLLSLSSVEDDALGEELRVVWEAEVGRRVRPQATLPEVDATKFDDPSVFAAFIDAVTWGAVTSAERNTLQAPFRSGIEIEEYQLEPLVRALGQPRVSMLLADDVGLGKTIEAGLIVQEFLLRHRIRRIMVVCPATLTLKWKTEMAEKFGLDFTIIDSDCLKHLRRTHGINANPFRVFPRTIVSLQWLPGPRAERVLSDFLPSTPTYPRAFDLLIVDEAHHIAPKAPKANYAVDSQRTKTVRRLAQHFEHRLFLSATPHNGYRESWTALLAILDPLRFARGVEPDEKARREVVVRRMKDTIRRPDGTPRFPARNVESLEVEYSEIDRGAHRLLQEFTNARRERVAGDARRRSAVDIATLLLKKRLFSSPIAFSKTIDHYADTLRTRQRAEDASGPHANGDRDPAWLHDLELAGQEEADDEAKAEAERDQLSRTGAMEAVLTSDEDRILAELIAWTRRHGERPDAKARRLLDYLENTCGPKAAPTRERVVVFTEYRDTQKWLAELLEMRGLGGDRLRLLYGGQDDDDREEIKNAFQSAQAPVRILLATDCAGEGIDLQLQCHRVVNYDIPFNPNRLEQRIGRIDRHGQRHHPEAIHFVGAGWRDAPPGSYEGDLEFLARVARKVAAQSEDLGEVNAILEGAIQSHMVGKATGVNPETLRASGATSALKAERDLRARFDELGARLRQSIDDLRVHPSNLERVATTALALARQPALQPDAAAGKGLFRLPNLSGIWARAALGIEDPFTGQPRPITFAPELAAGRQDVVLAHLGHPLLATATRLLRAAVWGTDHGGLNRVSAWVGEGLPLETTLLIGFSRLVLVGADGGRLHEEVFPTAGWMRNGRFASLPVGQTADLAHRILAIANPQPVSPAETTRLAAEWKSVSPLLLTATKNRAGEREQSLRGRLDNARVEEIKRLEQAIGQFRQTLDRALAEPDLQARQLKLFDEHERDQMRRDVETWRATRATLDEQLASERAQVERRYSAIKPLVFPAGVLFVVPVVGAR